MMEHQPQILIGIPLLGAALGLLFWSRPVASKIWAFLVTLAALLMVIGVSGTPLLSLLPLAALPAILAQSPEKEAGAVLFGMLILLGLGLGFLTSPAGQSDLAITLLMILLGLLSLLIYRYSKSKGPKFWWGIGTCGFGIVGLLISLTAAPPVRNVALLLVYSVLLPLFPFHGGYVAALAGLPGTLPAFLAVLLPSIGLHGVLILLPDLPPDFLNMLVGLALAGALYASLKALVQSRVIHLLAYTGLAFFSILWWYLATTRIYSPQAACYAGAVALTTEGLLLAWYGVRIRYGDLDLDQIGGLAGPMTRFAVLLSLLAMAAMGLPPFGLFSGYMEMLLNPSIRSSWGWAVILLTWLVASWYVLSLVQRILFGPPRLNILYEDLRPTEVASIVIVLLILIALGIAPHYFFASSDTLTIGSPRPPLELSLWTN